MFKDCITFQQDDDLDIEGLTYEEIEAKPELRAYLDKLKQNLPGYFMKSPYQKSWYFRKMNKQYG